MSHKQHDIGVAKHIGPYSDAIETTSNLRWLYTAGTPGMTHAGVVLPTIEEQSREAWNHILEELRRANMTISDIVKVSTYLIKASDVAAYAKIRSEVLGDARPAFMLSIVTQLIRPEVLVEVEVIAAAK